MGRAEVATGAAPQVRRVELSIGGMTCAACVARVEKTLDSIPDITATVNFATEKALVTAPAAVAVEQLIEIVTQAGYSAEVARKGVNSAGGRSASLEAEHDRTAYLRHRLVVALIFFVPLSDLSVQLSLFPAFRFAGWQWVGGWSLHAMLANAASALAVKDTDGPELEGCECPG